MYTCTFADVFPGLVYRFQFGFSMDPYVFILTVLQRLNSEISMQLVAGLRENNIFSYILLTRPTGRDRKPGRWQGEPDWSEEACPCLSINRRKHCGIEGHWNSRAEEEADSTGCILFPHTAAFISLISHTKGVLWHQAHGNTAPPTRGEDARFAFLNRDRLIPTDLGEPRPHWTFWYQTAEQPKGDLMLLCLITLNSKLR